MGALKMEEKVQNFNPERADKVDPSDTRRSLELLYIQDKLKSFHQSLMKDVDMRMNHMIDEIMQEIRQNDLISKEFQSFAKTSNYHQAHSHNTWDNRIPTLVPSTHKNGLKVSADQTDHQIRSKSQNGRNTGATKQLPEKIFVMRESYLTALLQIPHMKSIYHIFYTILLAFLLNSICYDYFVEGRVNFGLGTFQVGFGKLDLVLVILIIQNLMAVGLFYAIKGWAYLRSVLQTRRYLQSFWSLSCLSLYIGFQLVFYYQASVLCLRLNLPFVTSSVLLLESTRMVMKMHSFVRVMAARFVNGKAKCEAQQPQQQMKVAMPPLTAFIYFLFAPTLIYRDSYPRTSQIRWRFALTRFLEVVAVAFLYSYIHERYIRVHFLNTGLVELTASSLIIKLFGMIVPSVVIFLCGFYLILHAWLNFTSEILRFGDRMFYKDWWTSHNFDGYFRNWNVVVHDWLYEYIYKDFYNHVFKGSKLACSLMVFMISALVHEHILGFALQVFFPIMFLFFGVFGVGFIYLTRKLPQSLGNIFLWFSLIFGNTLMVSFYCMEYYAVQNCPKVYNSWIDYIQPALWSSNCSASTISNLSN